MTLKYDPNKRLKRLDAGLYLLETYGVGSPTYLATLAVRGGGPKFELIRNRAMYTVGELDAWALERENERSSRTLNVGGSHD